MLSVGRWTFCLEFEFRTSNVQHPTFTVQVEAVEAQEEVGEGLPLGAGRGGRGEVSPGFEVELVFGEEVDGAPCVGGAEAVEELEEAEGAGGVAGVFREAQE